MRMTMRDEQEDMDLDARHTFELCRNAHFPGMYDFPHCATCHREKDNEIHQIEGL